MRAPVLWPRLGPRPEAALASVGVVAASPIDAASASSDASTRARGPARLMPACRPPAWKLIRTARSARNARSKQLWSVLDRLPLRFVRRTIDACQRPDRRARKLL